MMTDWTFCIDTDTPYKEASGFLSHARAATVTRVETGDKPRIESRNRSKID